MQNFAQISDEELLLFYRKGDECALKDLTERFFHMRFFCCRKAAPELMYRLDDWTINEVFFRSFLNAVNGYEFTRVKFLTYYTHVLRNEMIREVEHLDSQGQTVLSLDEERLVYVNHNESYTLADVISSDDFKDDPAAFLSYAESLKSIDRLPKGISKESVEMASRIADGESIDSVAASFGVSRSNARYQVSKYRKWALNTLTKTYDLNRRSQKKKEKILGSLLTETTKDEVVDA